MTGPIFAGGYKDNEPAKHVSEKILNSGKDAYWVKGTDADNFFVQLADKLGCFPPGFFGTPFSHLKTVMSSVAGFKLPDQEKEFDWAVDAQERIDSAIEAFEGANEVQRSSPEKVKGKYKFTGSKELAKKGSISRIIQAFMASKYDEVVKLALPIHQAGNTSKELASTLAWAFIGQGNNLSSKAEKRSGSASEKLLKAAAEKFADALKIKPDMHEALNNWGNALLAQAEKKDGAAAAEKLIKMAYGKLTQAEKIEPGSAAYNLACLMALQGKKAGCRKWLNRSKKAGRLPTLKHLKADEDLDSVRNETWFKNFLKKLKP